MAIRVGSLVTRKSEIDGHNACVGLIAPDEENDIILRVCVGMVIDAIPGESEVAVNWLQICPFGDKRGQISQEGIEMHLLTEIGQLIPESDKCVHCRAFVYKDRQTLVDTTGGDVCGHNGGNEPHEL